MTVIGHGAEHNPVIIGRWLKWKGERWYAVCKTIEPNTDLKKNRIRWYIRLNGVTYARRDKVKITDELACSRVDLGPVWVTCWDGPTTKDAITRQLVHVDPDGDYTFKATEEGWGCTGFKNARLATIEEIENKMIVDFNEPIYKNFLSEEIAAGRIITENGRLTVKEGEYNDKV